MISTRCAVLATAMIIGVVGISVTAAAPQAAEATAVNTTRSNIKASPIIQQDGDVSCINQAQGQGGQQAVPNTEQNAAGGDRSDPIPDIDVKMGKNPGGSGAGAGINSEGDPTVNADLSNECALTQNLEANQNAESGDDLSTNEWDG